MFFLFSFFLMLISISSSMKDTSPNFVFTYAVLLLFICFPREISYHWLSLMDNVQFTLRIMMNFLQGVWTQQIITALWMKHGWRRVVMSAFVRPMVHRALLSCVGWYQCHSIVMQCGININVVPLAWFVRLVSYRSPIAFKTFILLSSVFVGVWCNIAWR